MKKTKLLLPFFVFGFLFTSCSKDDDILENQTAEVQEIPETRNLEVEEFIYAGMNEIYLYKDDVPELGDSYFPSNTGRTNFLKSFDSPEDLYEGIQSLDDKFSFMTADYISLENSFKGRSTTNGMQLALYVYGSNDILAIVNYVLPNTSAEEQGIKRGDAFTQIDGQQMTRSNYEELMNANSYTITLARLENNTIHQTKETVSLTKEEYDANPIYIVKTFEVEGIQVGYIMYNSFTSDYDEQLNTAFAELKAKGITELVLDLRYNGGGSVATAVGLAGMITGQFKGEVFIKEQWNSKYQNAWEAESYVSRFSDKITLNPNTDDEMELAINSLGLSKVHILTTNRSASASELVINGLDPYIDVVQIGDTTTGKFQASVTLYDSPNFGRTNANKNHAYAIQPLVYKSANAQGISDYVDGLAPDIKVEEDLNNMGVLGDENELLLKAALNRIAGIPQDQEKISKAKRAAEKFKIIGESGMNELNYQRMYIDKVPEMINRNK